MAEAVQLMMILQIGKPLFDAGERVIGIQVAVSLLGRADGGDGRFHLGPQGIIRGQGQLIGRRLDPLVPVAVLKHPAIEQIGIGLGWMGPFYHDAAGFLTGNILPAGLFGGHRPGGGPHVVHPPAGGRAFDAVVQRLPLIGQHGGTDQLLLSFPEGVRDLYFT